MGFFDFLKPRRKDLPKLLLHNTLSGKTEEFIPLSGTVKMYNCGPTVYDKQHIGNLFSAIFVNTLRRTLDVWGYKVKQVVNITDFGHLSSDADEGEDKMSLGLKREGLEPTLENMRVLAQKYTQAYLEDIEALGIDTHTVTLPRASEYVPAQIKLIKTLEQRGFAYKISGGVYFDAAKFKDYGKLGNINLAGQEAGARVEHNPEKRGAQDFALWKFSKELGWESPWGKGFPGWHIECTAMVFELLGEQIDIHTGGIEHIPIHHNNEIAQAEGASGKEPFSRFWLHNAHITTEGTKISKSLGNTVYLSDIVERGYSPLALRYWALTGHYRTPMNFTWEALEAADQALKRLTRTYLELPEGKVNGEFMKAFYAALAQDLDTPKALALVWDKLQSLNKATLRETDKVLGLGLADAKAEVVPETVQKLAQEREEARKNKDFAKADELRKDIEQTGFEVKDTAEGPKITRK